MEMKRVGEKERERDKGRGGIKEEGGKEIARKRCSWERWKRNRDGGEST